MTLFFIPLVAGGEGGIWLERPFKEDEVFEVEKALNKAPRPDDFIIGSLKACWEVLKVEIMNVFHDFHRGLNQAFRPLSLL
jgi:hypothetical protein